MTITEIMEMDAQFHVLWKLDGNVQDKSQPVLILAKLSVEMDWFSVLRNVMTEILLILMGKFYKINFSRCTSTCTIERGFTCPTAGSACIPTCGDGYYVKGEACEDGNTFNNDGCNSICKFREVGWTCYGGSLTTKQTCVEKCGDGRKVGSEACDDFNTISGDGCSSNCKSIETGYTCATVGSACTPICGDNLTLGSEFCDDGGLDDSTFCNAFCTDAAIGYKCTKTSSTKSTCEKICGNGKLDYIIQGTHIFNDKCDDGNTLAGDGCSSTCEIETGWSCSRSALIIPDICKPICGDGLINSYEVCDDGNTNLETDGCSSDCKSIDTGYVCPLAGKSCYAACGDGIRVAIEECDDNGRVNGDGCSIDCKIENGYTCST